MLQLTTNPQETLTAKVWETWRSAGYIERQNSLTWIEVNNLSGYFLKLCKEKEVDYQAYDFQNIIDKQLNYYENQSALTEAVGNPDSKDEAAYKAYHYVNNNDGKPEYCQYCGNKLKPNATKCNICGAPIKEDTPKGFKIPNCLKPKQQIRLLDAFAGAMIFVVWLATTGWALSSFAISWGIIVGLAIFWIFFVILFRMAVGGLLD